MSYRIGIDIGGTFTDMIFLAADGALVVTKGPTTPERRPECRFSRVRRYPRVSPMGECCRMDNGFRVLAALFA